MKENLNILLVEDNLIEVMKLKRALSQLDMHHTIIEAANGEVALDMLKNKTVNPDIILLDLNMPKISGLEFLAIVRNSDELKHYPIIILTTSNYQNDLLEAYRLCVSGYILKPLKYDDYVLKIKHILNYWCSNELKLV